MIIVLATPAVVLCDDILADNIATICLRCLDRIVVD
jgi:hypothetical protein